MYSFKSSSIIKLPGGSRIKVGNTPEGAQLRRDSLIMSPIEETTLALKQGKAMLPQPDLSPVAADATSIDLSSRRDQEELLDAVTRLLRVTDIDVGEKRAWTTSFRAAIDNVESGTAAIADKSIIVFMLLTDINETANLDDSEGILRRLRVPLATLEA